MTSRLGSGPALDAAMVAALARARLDAAHRSFDPVTRSLAGAADWLPPAAGAVPTPPPPPSAHRPTVVLPGVSTMIHGTWGWRGDWWRPRSRFHEFIRLNYRPGLYSGGARFSWSGAFSQQHRALAAKDFGDWAADMAPAGLRSLFGHSYGGEIAARACNSGVVVGELVLLSTPATSHVVTATANAPRVVDVRLRFDPVLAIAGTPQRIPDRPNVTEVLLRQWRLSHSATHEVDVWEEEDVGRRGELRVDADLPGR
jgi:pimeloyl-ACP methyl ester carboxylesterase